MSSTDDAFIKAFRDRQRLDRAVEMSQRKSYVVGTSPQPINEFVAGVTQPVNMPDTPVTQPQPTPADNQRHRTINDRGPRRSPKAAAQRPMAAESVELRIDAATPTVVPPPHTSISAFAALPDTPVTAAPSKNPNKRSSQETTGNKNIRIEPAHRPRRQRRRRRPAQQRSRTAQQPASSRATPPPQPSQQQPARPANVTTVTPMWEVDALQWPAVCCRLQQQCEQQLTALVHDILTAAHGASRVIAVTERERGEGATTLALCLAQTAARLTENVALVDGDMTKPQIAASLGLSFTRGWEEASAEVPLAETSVSALTDRLVVVPLGEKSGLLAADANHDGAHILEQLSHSFQLVILDVGPLFAAAKPWFAKPTVQLVDLALVLQDVRSTAAPPVHKVRSQLVQHGVEEVFIVENFHGPAGGSQPTSPPKLIR